MESGSHYWFSQDSAVEAGKLMKIYMIWEKIELESVILEGLLLLVAFRGKLQKEQVGLMGNSFW